MVKLMISPKPNSPHYGYGFQMMDGGFGHTGGFPGISTSAIYYPDDYRLIVLANIDAGSAVVNAMLLRMAGLAPAQ
jgi:hypothetical protein